MEAVMSALSLLFVACATLHADPPEVRSPGIALRIPQEKTDTADRIELKKDGGPGHGPDQPYSVREIGASDLEQFVGGKQVVFIEPYDLFLVIVIVAVVVVLVVVL
jgi:hypothetical protein